MEHEIYPKFTWHTEDVPAGMAIRQVYGFCFDEHGRVLMRVDHHKHNLPGGRPESGDQGLAATLARECLEEVSIRIVNAEYLGFQCVDDGDGQPPYAQVRMVSLIAEVLPSQPDPDTGRQYGRLLTVPALAGDLLNWGDLGRIQTRDAARLASLRFGTPVDVVAPPIQLP